jgi:N-acetyl-gamma-glutamyl-phosphate reductase
MGKRAPPGLRIHEYLAQRADVQVLRIAPEQRKDSAERARLLNAADVAFLCLPDAASREAAALITNPDTCLIDASTAHRTVPGWAFGLPELAPGQRDVLRQRQAHRQPGLPRQRLHPAAAAAGGRGPGAGGAHGLCHVHHRLLGRWQEDDRAVSSWLLPLELSLRSLRRDLTRLSLAHKHVPEMMAHTGLSTAPIFMPMVGNFYKGLAVSVPLDLVALGTTAEALAAGL